jgi:hypothetical protein
VQLATAYNRLRRKDDADRERAIVDRLNREIQEKQSAVNGNGDGNTTPAPTSTPSSPEGPPQ